MQPCADSESLPHPGRIRQGGASKLSLPVTSVNPPDAQVWHFYLLRTGQKATQRGTQV